MSTFFITNKSTVYDLGCSTGLTLRAIGDFNLNKKFKLVGIDVSKDMIDKAKLNTNKKKYNKIKINYLCKDVLRAKLEKSDLITSNYFIQFIHPRYRQTIFDKIYKSLNYGGGFIFLKKLEVLMLDFKICLHNFIMILNLSLVLQKEILNKTKSIRGYLEPFKKANIDFLKRAGFKDYTTVFKYYSFQGFLAIK